MLEKLEEIRRKYDEIKARLGDPQFVQDHRAVRDAIRDRRPRHPHLCR